VTISTSNCHNSDCLGAQGQVPFDITMNCAGATARAWDRNHGSGANIVDIYVNVPKDDDQALIRVGNAANRNMEGGYCGGWTDTNGLYTTLNNQNRDCKSPKYRDATCESFFTASAESSIFAAFEHWSGGAYDSKHSTEDAEAVAASITPFSQFKFDQARSKCVDYGQTAFPTVTFTETPTTPREMVLYMTVEDCAEDTYFGLPWNSILFSDQFCEAVDFRVQQERKDVYCATELLYQKGQEVDPRTHLEPLLRNAKTQADVEALGDLTDEVGILAEEVVSSADNIEYWHSGLCALQIHQTPELENTHCHAWVFKDSQNLEDQALFKQSKTHMMSHTVTVSHTPVSIAVDQSFFQPVIFVTPPKFVGDIPTVPRVSFNSGENQSFDLFLRTPKCRSFGHVGEEVGYLVFDSQRDYTGFEVFTAEVTGSAWQTITYPDMGANALVFTTIQSANNNACPTCTSAEGVNGYVSVRVRSVTATSCEVRLEPDTSSTAAGVALESETVGFLVTSTTDGMVGDVRFKAGSIQSGNSVGNTDKTKPTTLQSAAVPGFDHVPVVMATVNSANDDLPAQLRTTVFESNIYKFKVDRDVCSAAHGSQRSHGGEKVAWVAFEKL